jgi:alginate O-acetyltransferase complex protein AlgJ
MSIRYAVVFAILTGSAVRADTPADDFRRAAQAKAAILAKAEVHAFRGADGFYFLTSELKHYGAGPFWGESAAGVSAATANQDPLIAILDFQTQLKKAGVQLIFVPVPGKALVDPDKFDAKLRTGARLDAAHQAFFALLRKEGIEVIDLLPAMLDLRKTGAESHCKQDSHWSPAATKLAAQSIARAIKGQPWYAAPMRKIERTEEAIEIQGDLVQLLKDNREPREKLTIERIRMDGKPVTDNRDSPIILMGDSHTLVYHEPINGSIAANDAGLLDHLAAELGIAPDMTGVLGSGANASRITLARRKDNLAAKKCIVWVIAARELTESAQGWLKIPVVR